MAASLGEGEGRSVLAAACRLFRAQRSRVPTTKGDTEKEKRAAAVPGLIPNLLTHWAVRPAASARSAAEKNMADQTVGLSLRHRARIPSEPATHDVRAPEPRPRESRAACRCLGRGGGDARRLAGTAGAQWAETFPGRGGAKASQVHKRLGPTGCDWGLNLERKSL